MKKVLISLGIIAIIAFIACGYLYPKTQTVLGAVGDTNQSPRIAQVIASGLATTTWASFYNGDVADRVITSIDYYEQGLASTSALTLQAATSSYPAELGGNTNYIFNTVLLTTWPDYQASSTPTAMTAAYRIWKSGSYLNFKSNGTTTSATTTISIRVNYMPL